MALTDDAVQQAAGALMAQLQSAGCTPGFDPVVQAFQSAYTDAGGVLPRDSNGSSGIDGLYGNNTRAALQAVLDANPNPGPPQTAPAGCVGAAPSGGGGGTIVVPPANTTTNTTTNNMSTFFSSMSPLTKWGLAAAAVLVVGYAVVEAGHHPGKAAKRARKGMQHHARRLTGGHRRAVRRRRR